MLTLYKKTGNKILYWHALELSRRKGYIYTSEVGETEGETQEVTTGLFSTFAKHIAQTAEELRAQGYVEDMKNDTLVICYRDELSEEQFKALHEGLEEYIGDRNLGYIDDTFSRSTIYCLVPDYGLALTHIKNYLGGTVFADYKEIYNLDDVSTDVQDDEEDEI